MTSKFRKTEDMKWYIFCIQINKWKIYWFAQKPHQK